MRIASSVSLCHAKMSFIALAGGPRKESPWIFSQLSAFSVPSLVGKKTKFAYRLPGVGAVCRQAWILAAGFPNPNNSRIRSLEKDIRKGVQTHARNITAETYRKRKVLTATAYAKAFLHAYILGNSEASPSNTELYVDFCGLDQLYAKYRKDSSRMYRRPLKKESLARLWRAVLKVGVTDPKTEIHFPVTKIRKASARGFKMCNTCEYFRMKMQTVIPSKRARQKAALSAHIADVEDDRLELARIARLCTIDPDHVGFYLDAADSCKFSIPTTTSKAKLISQLWRVKQKLTCVQMFKDNQLLVFRTLPNVPTGGNLTVTIICRLFGLGLFSACTDIYINFDGAGDNVCYTVVYALVHLLLSARKSGWPLKRIHLLRFKVGHTHNQLDATFGVLSRYVYGKMSKGDSIKNIFSFTGFRKVCWFYMFPHPRTYPTYSQLPSPVPDV